MGSSRSSVKRGRPAKQALFGYEQPRIFTPPLRPLTRKTSLGFECIEFAENVVGMRLNPWQKWFLIHALELNPDGTFRFRTVLLMVARQNGKTTVLQLLTLWRMYVDGAKLIIGTAQNLDIAEETWEGTVQIAESVEELAAEIAPQRGIVRNNGKKALMLNSLARYKVQTASRKGGRSLSADMTLLDELREHHTYEAWGAITKTTMARAKAQNVAASNAGDKFSIVLNDLRKLAHGRLGDPDKLFKKDEPLPAPDDTFGLFEYSAPPGCDIWDRDGWAMANPSLGYTITEESIASAAATDPENVFRTEVLCQKVDSLIITPWPEGVWAAGTDEKSSIPLEGRFAFCVDMSADRQTCHIAVAGRRDDGRIHVEIVASRAGSDWVKPWLEKRQGHPLLIGVVLQSNGAPVSSLLTSLDTLTCDVIEWSGADLGRWTGQFYDLVTAGAKAKKVKVGQEIPQHLTHRAQPVLDVPAATASKKKLGDAFVWDRNASPTDIAPLVAATGAVGALLDFREPEQVTSVYENRRLVVV